MLVVPFAILGAVLPTPSYRQYYYLVVPFLLLGTVFGIARFWSSPAQHVMLARILMVALGAGVVELCFALHGSNVLVRPDRWAVFDVHRTGLEIRRLVGAGPVLTLAPIYPLEGGARIYKEFCTGPFAWRLSPFVREEQRLRYGLVDPSKLDAYLAEAPPAILTRVEEKVLERPLVEYAQRNGYTRVILANGAFVWIRRAPENQATPASEL